MGTLDLGKYFTYFFKNFMICQNCFPRLWVCSSNFLIDNS